MIDVGGVGYELEAPMSTFYDLPDVGREVLLFTHYAQKEDSVSLYGFLREPERRLFRDVQKVTGIGAKIALAVLSGTSVDEFARLVQTGDVTALTRIPGIGKKTAERMVVELRDRAADLAGSPVAASAGLPKANLHYYFTNKLGLYIAVLSNILELWDSTFNALTAEDDPAEALTRYIRTKMEFSRRQPQASRIFAMEIISGGECLTEYFSQDYRTWFSGRAAVFQAWIDAGKMDPVDPVHLIFLLWGSTQHYADFATQICRVTGRTKLTKQDMEDAGNNLIHIILKGCGIKPAL